MKALPYLHFPLTSARYELHESWGAIGQRFKTEIIPMGQIDLRSGRLAIGDPLVGMTSASNSWLGILPGAYSVAMTRLICMDKSDLEIPAYLSIILDHIALDMRRTSQEESQQIEKDPGLEDSLIGVLSVSESGEMVEQDAFDDGDAGETFVCRSGVVGMVDESAFERRMPNPLHIQGGWFERFFDSGSSDSWIKILDDPHHLTEGVANLTLPMGPDDWMDSTPPTIALAQMISPGDCIVFVEYAKDDEKRISPIAVHIELGLMASVLSST